MKQKKIFSISITMQDLKGHGYSISLNWSENRVQMQRFASDSDSVTVQRQTLTE